MATGRLALSWVGRDQALLKTADGGYEWVAREDPRVTEVRLFREVSKTGEVSGTPSDNLLIQGDSYDALRALARNPQYKDAYQGKVKLVYIDPPFNTGQAFDQYDDALEHSIWLTMMRDRLLLIRDLLAPDGSVWVHLDDAEMAYCRVMMDEIFGRSNFVATVVWQKVYSPKNSAKHLSVDQDYILVYAVNGDAWRPNELARTEKMNSAYRNPDDDPRGPWKPGDLLANKPYSLGRYPITTPSGRVVEGPPPGRYWRISEARLKELDEDDRIWWGERGDNVPAIKRFLSEVRGRVPQTLWPYSEVGHNQTGKNEIQSLFPAVTPFATPKAEALIERIISIATNPGDIVLDCFGGSGTTAAVAHKMRRSWLTVEREAHTVERFIHPRLEKVVAGTDPGGVTKAVGWESGGGFRSLEVAPSAWVVDGNRLFLADWTSGEELAAVVAAQLGFTLEISADGPFCGRRGRARLAVVDGVVDEVVARGVLGQLEDGERAVMVGRGVSPEAQSLIAELSPGSKVLKAPRDLVQRGKVVR